VLRAVDDEFARVARDGITERELRRVVTRLTTQILVASEPVLGRTQLLAALELRHGRAELLAELPELLDRVDAEQVRAAAATITPDSRGVVELRPRDRAGEQERVA
jgi:predicted Zn-dependent peptidase